MNQHVKFHFQTNLFGRKNSPSRCINHFLRSPKKKKDELVYKKKRKEKEKHYTNMFALNRICDKKSPGTSLTGCSRTTLGDCSHQTLSSWETFNFNNPSQSLSLFTTLSHWNLPCHFSLLCVEQHQFIIFCISTVFQEFHIVTPIVHLGSYIS